MIGASYRRGGDLVGRWEGGTFAVLTQGEAARERLAIRPGRGPARARPADSPPHGGHGRYVTLSAGIASLVPPRTLAVEGLLKACAAALKRAKKSGKNSIATAEATDFHG